MDGAEAVNPLANQAPRSPFSSRDMAICCGSPRIAARVTRSAKSAKLFGLKTSEMLVKPTSRSKFKREGLVSQKLSSLSSEAQVLTHFGCTGVVRRVLRKSDALILSPAP